MAANPHPVPSIMKQGRVAPWLYLAPALAIMLIFVVYPTLNTVWLSFRDADGAASAAETCRDGQPCWGVFENYRYALTNELALGEKYSGPGALWSSFWSSSYGNNLKWLLIMVSGSVGFGLMVAVLTDGVKYEPLAKAIIFLPMAISFVGAGVIWKFVYDFGTGRVQIGLLNSILRAVGLEPVAWLASQPINTLALIAVGIWMWTGFCMTILSAALKGVPTEVLEAARVDGANEWQVFMRVMLPMISPTVLVVITTMVINVLKIFDIVYVMTGGNFGTEVIANRMYSEMYIRFHGGRGTAIAVVLIVLIVPFMIMNIRRFREQEAMR